MLIAQNLGDSGQIMNGYTFTDRVRKVLQMAREEAARLHHEYVGTEHLLLGLIREGEGVAAAVLTNLGVDFEEIVEKIERTVKKGKAREVVGRDLPYTSRAKTTIELAMSEARRLDSSYVGTEHLLLGTLAEETGIAAQVLTDAGVTLDAARAETVRMLSDPGARREAPADGSVLRERRMRRAAILVKASELINELMGQAPDPDRVRAIGTELKALVDELGGLF